MNTNKNMYYPLPKYLTVSRSYIDNLGLIAVDNIEEGTIMGVSHVYNVDFQHNYIRTPLGGFINHSEDPNCELIDSGIYKELRTTKDIKIGEELTLKYSLYEVCNYLNK